MDYRLENIDSTQFENLVNTICQKILGTGIISFSAGKDGGRDGKFTGTAQQFPSDKKSWSGKFIIQSKHTSIPNASCSDSDFKTIIKIEIKKIKNLMLNNDIDNYLLFTNRKYSGVVGENLNKKIIEDTGLSNVAIIGMETINDTYLNSNKDIVRQYKLDTAIIPFDFSDDEIKEIIVAFSEELAQNSKKIQEKVDELKYNYTYINKDEKNKKNKLSENYFENNIVKNSLMDFHKIEQFLNDPINETYKNYYFDTANELKEIISLKRDNFDAFEELFVYIYKIVCDGSSILKGRKRHVTTFLHYMYYECLIGEK